MLMHACILRSTVFLQQSDAAATFSFRCTFWCGYYMRPETCKLDTDTSQQGRLGNKVAPYIQ